MPKCPKCGAAMATVLKREGGQVRTYYKCIACEEESQSPESESGEAESDTQRIFWPIEAVDGFLGV